MHEIPPSHATPSWLPPSLIALRRDGLFLVLLCAFAVLCVAAPEKILDYPRLVDWPTMAALAGLLILTKGLEMSGALHRGAHWLLDRTASERTLALCLVAMTAALSMLLTNDVALFAMVPLTLGVCRLGGIAPTRLIVFEALAVNAGSALTPIGNPQNLFLWQQWNISFGQFVVQMLPLVAAMLVLLFAFTWCAFPHRVIRLGEDPPARLDRTLLTMATLLYAPFLVLADMHHVGWALLAVALAFGMLRPRVLPAIDWGLLIVFVLMFIDLRLIASLDSVRSGISALGLDRPRHLFWAGVGASQLISNVPAAIALAEYSHDWRTIAWGVNVGGFGVLVGSLANLIALRMAPGPHKYRIFHLWSAPFLLCAAALGYVLL